jgi:hypothetical protein
MTQHEYNAEITAIAEWINDNRPADLGGEGFAADYPEGADQWDALHERLDGHSWTTWTHQSRQVISHTDNPDYLMDEFGADAGGSMFDERRAFYAMYADIQDRAEHDQYDLDELRTERFEEITTSDRFTQWVRETIKSVTVPVWSAATVEETHEIDGITVDLSWMPNSTRRIVVITDDDYNETKIAA